jgi:RimJ/RimL family protein N-acetyltransferase
MPEASEGRIEIRAGVPADGAALGRTIKQIDAETEYLGEPGEALPWTGREGDHLRELEENGAGVYFLAFDGAAVVGFLGAFTGWFARNRGVVYIAHIGLRAAYRGRRIGGKLLDAVKSWARERGAHRLELQVALGNAPALSLYRRQGFAIEGFMADSFRGSGRSYDCYLMGKLLIELPPAMRVTAPSPTAPAAPLDTPVALRMLRAEDWRALMDWETILLRDTKLMLKVPSEISPAERFASEIAEAVGNERCHLLAATVVEDGAERIVGYATVSIEPFSRMAHMGFVFIGVLPAHRRRGIGSRLAAGLEAWAAERGLSRLTGFAQAASVPARSFAARMGYQEEVLMRGYAIIDGMPSDRIRFGKAVAPPTPTLPPQGGRGKLAEAG